MLYRLACLSLVPVFAAGPAWAGESADPRTAGGAGRTAQVERHVPTEEHYWRRVTIQDEPVVEERMVVRRPQLVVRGSIAESSGGREIRGFGLVEERATGAASGRNAGYRSDRW